MKRFIVAGVLLFALGPSVALARGKDVDAPPGGLNPTTATLAQILKAYDNATGKRAPGLADTSIEEWTFTRAGLAGTESLSRSGHDYHMRIATAGPLVEEYGQFLGRGWHRDYNGVVSPLSSENVDGFEMLLFMDSLNDAADPKYDVKVLGETTDAKAAYVVSIKKTGRKHAEFVTYDKQSGLVTSVSQVVDGVRATVTYDDYRSTKGLTQPWHVHYTNGTTVLDDDFKRTSLQVGAPLDAAQFTIPPSRLTFATFNGSQKLPAKIRTFAELIDVGNSYIHATSGPTVIVRVDVGGRGLDFSLSSAQPHTIIDFDVAQEMQLSPFGQATHADGDPVAYNTILPQVQIGGLTLRNLAVEATPFHYHAGGDIKVVGVLGYDVLSTGVFKIDYENETLELFPARDWDNTAMATSADTATLPVTFDGGYPFFSGTLDSTVTQNILFDNDLEMSLLFGTYVNAHPASVKDVVNGKTHGSTTIPFADSKGYGRTASVWLSKIPDIQFGPAHFLNYQIIAVDEEEDFGGRATDAVMGGDLLKYYDIYLDYPHNRIFLRPNKSFFKMFKVAQ